MDLSNPYGLAVNTSITQPTPYSQNATALGKSQIYANAAQNASLPFLMKQVYNPSAGVSMGPALMQRTAPMAANALSGGRAAASGLETNDAMANANAALSGQSAREQQALNLGNLGLQQQNQNFQQAQTGYGTQMNLLGQLLNGGFMGGLVPPLGNFLQG